MQKSVIVILAFVVLMISFQEADCFIGGGIVNRPGSKRSQEERREVEVCKRVVKRCADVLMKEKRAVAKEMEDLEKLAI